MAMAIFIGIMCLSMATAIGTDLWSSLSPHRRVGLSIVCALWFAAGYVLRIAHSQ